MSTSEYRRAKVTAYRLMLALMHDDSDSIATVKRELNAVGKDDPQNVLAVLGVMSGLASAQWSLLHHMDPAFRTMTIDLRDRDREGASKALEEELAVAIDELNES